MPTIKSIKPPWVKSTSKTFANSKSDEFYRKMPWRNLRKHKLTSQPICEDCQAAGRVTTATDVHHIASRKDRPDLELELSNLKSLCRGCHKKYTQQQAAKARRK